MPYDKDTATLRRVWRLMLKKLEIQLKKASEQAELFSGKSSLVAALATVSEQLMKLKAQTELAQEEATLKQDGGLYVDPEDAAIISRHIDRLRDLS